MSFIHINEYYINLAHIYYVHDTEKGYVGSSHRKGNHC